MARVLPEEQFTSSVTLGMLVYVAHRLRERTAVLVERIEYALLPDLPVPPLGAAAARRYGEIRARLERLGTPISDADMRIAAIALSRGLMMVAGNEPLPARACAGDRELAGETDDL